MKEDLTKSIHAREAKLMEIIPWEGPSRSSADLLQSLLAASSFPVRQFEAHISVSNAKEYSNRALDFSTTLKVVVVVPDGHSIARSTPLADLGRQSIHSSQDLGYRPHRVALCHLEQ